MLPKKLISLSLALALTLLTLPATAETAPLSTPQDLKSALESPGEGSYTLAGDITLPFGMTIEVQGDKTLRIPNEAALMLQGQVTVPAESSLSVDGGNLVLDSDGPTALTVSGALNLYETILYAYAHDWGVAIENTGGHIALKGSALRVACQQDGVGLYNHPDSTFTLSDGLLEVRSEGGEHGYYSVALRNDGGQMHFEQTAMILSNGGLSMGIQQAEGGNMTIAGGSLFVTNFHMSTGIETDGQLTLTDVPIFFSSNAEGLVASGGITTFERCTLSFLAGENNPPNLTHKSGRLHFANSAFVVDTHSRCIASAGELSFDGNNVLLRRGDGLLLSSIDGHAIDQPRWAGVYRDISVQAYETRPRLRYIEDFTVKGSWPGHPVYVMDWMTQSLLPRQAVKVEGETLTLQAEGYLSGRLRVSGSAVADSYGLELHRLDPMAGYMAALTALSAAVMLIYQVRWGATYIPERRRHRS